MPNCDSTSFDATIAAELARHRDADNAAEKAHRAAVWQAKLALARARLALSEIDKDKATERAKAQTSVDKAKQDLDRIEGDLAERSFQPVRASRKALETPAHKFEQYPDPTIHPPRAAVARRLLSGLFLHRIR